MHSFRGGEFAQRFFHLPGEALLNWQPMADRKRVSKQQYPESSLFFRAVLAIPQAEVIDPVERIVFAALLVGLRIRLVFKTDNRIGCVDIHLRIQVLRKENPGEYFPQSSASGAIITNSVKRLNKARLLESFCMGEQSQN